jgi:hypothetical protein
MRNGDRFMRTMSRLIQKFMELPATVASSAALRMLAAAGCNGQLKKEFK